MKILILILIAQAFGSNDWDDFKRKHKKDYKKNATEENIRYLL